MIAVLSPAKNMAPDAPCPLPLTRPFFWRDANDLAQALRALSPWQLESLLHVSPELALGAFQMYQNFSVEEGTGTAAMAAYRGLAYQNLNPQDFTLEDWTFARDHLSLLSALYGLLRPTDGIHPYRLEFLCKFRPNGRNLYAHWGSRVYEALFSQGEPVINLASQEYAKLLSPHLRAGDRMITCHFQVVRRGKRIALATESKMARGQMARFLIKGRLEDPQALQAFAWGGYVFQRELSTRDDYVYLKDH